MSNGGNVSNTGGNSGGLGSLLGLGGSDYNYQGTWRERFGDSLVTDRQKKIHAEREAQLIANRIKLSHHHTAALKQNIDKAVVATGGRPIDPAVVPNVDAQHAPKTNLHLMAGVPVKV